MVPRSFSAPSRRSSRGAPARPSPRWSSIRQLGALLSLLVVLAARAPAQNAQTAPPAREVTLAGLHGERLAPADLASGNSVVVVWASWSPRSRDIVERVNPLALRWQAKARVFTVDFQEDPKTVADFLAGKPLTVPVYFDADGTFAKRYQIATLPGLLVVKDGTVAYRGQLPDDPDRVLEKIFR
jgi:thiol-disulfide isomerase/thioredoxin